MNKLINYSLNECHPLSESNINIPFFQLALGRINHADGSVTVLGDTNKLIEHACKYMGGSKRIKPVRNGVLISKSRAYSAISFPAMVDLLPSGVELHYFWIGEDDCKYGVSATSYKNMPYSGIAVSISRLMDIITEDFGDEFHREIFGVPGSSAAIQHYEKEQADIISRGIEHEKTQSEKRIQAVLNNKLPFSSLTKEERQLVDKINLDSSKTLQEIRDIKWANTVHKGKVGNPRYQCFLDTVDDLSAINNNAPYFGWLSDRQIEYSKLERQFNIDLVRTMTIKQKKAHTKQSLSYSFDEYLKQFAITHQAARLIKLKEEKSN